jgi:hypothetical protein
MFLHPLALLGLAAAAIPALLHLLQRRTPPELVFPPLRYLAAAERASARRLRLRHLLLLILRTALIVCLVLAAARPLVPARAGGAHGPTAVVVILDNSASAGAVTEGRQVLDRLRVVAHTALARSGPADRVWLMLADGVPRAGGREALLAAVDSVRADGPRLDLVSAVGRAARLVQAEPHTGREVHVVSDLQRSALESGRVEVPEGVSVLALAPPAPPPNRGLVAARVTDGVVVADVGGTPGAEPVPVTLTIGGREVARALAAPGGGLSLALPPLGVGWWSGQLALDPDELRADDVRFLAWRVAPPAGVTAGPEAGAFVAAALAVLREGGRTVTGGGVTIGERPATGPAIVLPPADPALVGPANRALAARGVPWRFGAAGTPGALTSEALAPAAGAAVGRRLRLEAPRAAGGDSGLVLARVNGEPWLVRVGDVVLVGSRLDTSWTALPAHPGFVPFIDALVNRVARGEAAVTFAEGPAAVTFTRRGADTVAATVFGPDPRESDLTPADPELARTALGAAVRDDAAFAAEIYAGVRRADMSGALLLLALLLLITETAVALRTR